MTNFIGNIDYYLFAVTVVTLIGLTKYIANSIFAIEMYGTKFITAMLFILGLGYYATNWSGEKTAAYYETLLTEMIPTYSSEMESLGHEKLGIRSSPNDPVYLNLIERQVVWQKLNHRITDIYTMKKDRDGVFHLLVDSETDYNKNGQYDEARDQRTPIGEIYDKQVDLMNKAMTGTFVFTKNPYHDKWGNWVSAYGPIYNSKGEIDALIGVDFDSDEYVSEITYSRTRVILVTFVVLTLMALLNATTAIFQFQQAQIDNARIKSMNTARMATLGEMASGIAHEINNPLSIIRSNCENALISLTDVPNVPTKVYQRLEKIIATSDRISKIIKGLRTFARDGDKDPFVMTFMPNIIEATLELCRDKITRHSIRLDISHPDNMLDCAIECREIQISQVLINLLNNASDAISGKFENPWISLSYEMKDERIVIQVTDCGNGIPQELKEKIMTPFFTTKDPDRGTGLGLSISKGIIEAHNGRFYLDNDCPNTRFVIDLPRVQSKPAANNDSSDPSNTKVA